MMMMMSTRCSILLLICVSCQAWTSTPPSKLVKPQQVPTNKFMTTLGSLLLSTTLLFTNNIDTSASAAESAQVVAQIAGSGLVFKDTLQVERFEDPKVKGVVLYVANFQIPLTERIGSGKFFSDPSSASITCARTAASEDIILADNVNKTPQGEPVFSENKSLFFKSVRVQRVYDASSNTLIYVSFNTRLDKNDDSNKSRFQSSICAVPLASVNGASSSAVAGSGAAAGSAVAPTSTVAP